MYIKPITLALVGGIGGGSAGIPLLFWQWQQRESASPVPIISNNLRDIPREEPKQSLLPSEKDTEQGNCQVISLVGNLDFENILWSSGKEREDYVAISCQNTDSTNNKKILDNWTGLFPNYLLLNSYNLKLGKKFDMKTQTELLTDSEDYKTIFSGNRIVIPIIGQWKIVAETIAEKLVTVVNVLEGDFSREQSDFDPIYLLIENKN